MLLNCDLGESFGPWSMGQDATVMPLIDQANIACGFHAGDPATMAATLALAARHGVAVGAHPAYPDLAGFGRRSMQLSAADIHALLHYQIAALDGMAQCQGLALAHIKPHGALYNDMMREQRVRAAVLEAVASYHRPLVLVLQATPQAAQHRAEASAAGVTPMFEAFADRCYDDNGLLLPRSQPGALHPRERMLEQVAQLVSEGTVRTVSGAIIPLQVDTLCLHGDNPEAVAAAADIRALVSGR